MRYVCLLVTLSFMFAGCAEAQTRISHGDTLDNPIDVTFAECENDWDGSQLADWSACVSRADEQWRTSMNSSYRELMARLPRKDGLLLAKSQAAWSEAVAAERAFVESHGDLTVLYGAEGAISYRRGLMLKTRARALELAEHLQVFAHSRTQSNNSSKPTPLRGAA
ncbi:lysozyme inhibitor LprI family protein [Lysobacter sp. HA18]